MKVGEKREISKSANAKIERPKNSKMFKKRGYEEKKRKERILKGYLTMRRL
jgi:hypothetical protein